MSGHDISDRCFPLTLSIKRVSDAASYWSKQFHEAKCNGLNHPDLNRALISRWAEICKNIDNEKEAFKLLKPCIDEMINQLIL